MPQVDPLLKSLTRQGLETLLLRPGFPPRLGSGSRQVTAGNRVFDSEFIKTLVEEMIPEGLPNEEEGATSDFDYRLDGEQYTCSCAFSAVGWGLSVTRAETGADVARDDAGAAAPEVPVTADTSVDGAESAPRPTDEESAAAPAAPQPASSEPVPVPELDTLLKQVLDFDASDLHLSSDQIPRIRHDGDLAEMTEYAAPTSDLLNDLVAPLLPERNRIEFEQLNDTDFAYELPGKARFRVNLFRDRLGMGVVFRQIPQKIPTFEDLGLPEVLRNLTTLTKGLVLVTGPTGSGKSTTLAALVDLVNRTRRDHIITVEDPVEFIHKSRMCLVNQRQVGAHTSSFRSAIRAALREDPDVLLVGEMRDLETISMAIETAETGHLVFGTLHTTSAASTVERIVDQFPADRQEQIRSMLAESLRAVISQTLLKRIEGGRVGAFEILLCTPAISNLVREAKTFQIPSAMQTARGRGMQTLEDSLFKLVEEKAVAPEEAYRHAVDRESFANKLRAANISLAAKEPGAHAAGAQAPGAQPPGAAAIGTAAPDPQPSR